MPPNPKIDEQITTFQPEQNQPLVPDQEKLLELIEQFKTYYFEYQFEPERGFRYISASIQNLTGYSANDFIANANLFYEIVLPGDRDLVDHIFLGMRIDSLPVTFRIYHRQGEIAWLECTCMPIMDHENRQVGVKGLVRDATREHKVEIALLENQALMASIIDSTQDAIIILDSDLEIIAFNQSAEEMFGYLSGQVIGEPLDRLIPQPIPGYFRENVANFRKPDLHGYRMGTQWITTGVRSTGENFTIKAFISVFTVENQPFYTFIVRDITARKLTDVELIPVSTYDTLTGLNNRVFFENQMQDFENRGLFPISLVIVAVDNLKYINDMYGHASGDELLKQVAGLLRSAFRDQDVITRLGGDEFGIILPSADTHVVVESMKRIRSRLLSYNRVNRKLSISLSIGGATAFPGESLGNTLNRADQAMYDEKGTKHNLRSNINQ